MGSEKTWIFLCVFLGSGLGGVARYGSGIWLYQVAPSHFPTSTLCVNVVGSLLIGVLAFLSKNGEAWISNENVQIGLMVGFCGGFTTFSSFSLQTLELFQNERYWLCLWNILGNFILCLFAVWTGYILTQAIRT